METMLWDFLMFDQIFLSPQVKRSAIISNKQGVHELPRELPNDLITPRHFHRWAALRAHTRKKEDLES